MSAKDEPFIFLSIYNAGYQTAFLGNGIWWTYDDPQPGFNQYKVLQAKAIS